MVTEGRKAALAAIVGVHDVAVTVVVVVVVIVFVFVVLTKTAAEAQPPGVWSGSQRPPVGSPTG